MRGVILDRITLGDDLDLSGLLSLPVEWTVYENTSPDQVMERMAGAQIAISNKVAFSAQVLEQLPELGYIGLFATGTNLVDLPAAKAQGVAVTRLEAYCNAGLTQHVFAMLLSLTNALPQYNRISRDGTWSNSSFFSLYQTPIHELAGKTLVIVGYGELGKSVAQVAKAFGMEVLIASVPGSPSHAEGRISLAEGLRRADVLTLHCPLTEQTTNMIAADELRTMKSHAIILNTARGGIVNEHDLAQALKVGTIGGAGFDVLSVEPPPVNHPLLASDVPNLILTPHVAWAAVESRQRAAKQVEESVAAFLKGECVRRVV